MCSGPSCTCNDGQNRREPVVCDRRGGAEWGSGEGAGYPAGVADGRSRPKAATPRDDAVPGLPRPKRRVAQCNHTWVSKYTRIPITGPSAHITHKESNRFRFRLFFASASAISSHVGVGRRLFRMGNPFLYDNEDKQFHAPEPERPPWYIPHILSLPP